jgi:hypothetical protein
VAWHSESRKEGSEKGTFLIFADVEREWKAGHHQFYPTKEAAISDAPFSSLWSDIMDTAKTESGCLLRGIVLAVLLVVLLVASIFLGLCLFVD